MHAVSVVIHLVLLGAWGHLGELHDLVVVCHLHAGLATLVNLGESLVGFLLVRGHGLFADGFGGALSHLGLGAKVDLLLLDRRLHVSESVLELLLLALQFFLAGLLFAPFVLLGL